MCQGEVSTDNNTYDANATNANDGQSMIVYGSLVDKPNEPIMPLHHKNSQTINNNKNTK